MQITNQPLKLPIPFSNSGAKNTIPVPSQGPSSSAASLTDGFPVLTRTPLTVGGIPPDGLDMNGILYEITAINNWQNAGGMFTYDAAFSTSIAGYPKGAYLLRSDGNGFWFNTVDANTTNPETGGAGWVPQNNYGVATINGLTAGVNTLSPSDYSKEFIVLNGALTGNVQIVLPTLLARWSVFNNTTNAFSVTVKTASGTGVVISQGAHVDVIGDGTNIVSTSGGLTQTAADARYLQLTAALGPNQSWQDFTGSRAVNTTYTNSTGKPILVSGYVNNAGGATTSSIVSGLVVSNFNAASGAPAMPFFMYVPNGASYMLSITSGSVTGGSWAEYR